MLDLLRTDHFEGDENRHPDLGVTYKEVASEEANIYVTFSYSDSLSGIIEALDNYIIENRLEEDKVYMFLDPIVNNQWAVEEHANYKWYATSFKDVVVKIGHTVLVITPWTQFPDYLTRLWCLYEMYCTFETRKEKAQGARFGVAMSFEDKIYFIKALIGDLAGLGYCLHSF